MCGCHQNSNMVLTFSMLLISFNAAIFGVYLAMIKTTHKSHVLQDGNNLHIFKVASAYYFRQLFLGRNKRVSSMVYWVETQTPKP